jgi:hypothetical protein
VGQILTTNAVCSEHIPNIGRTWTIVTAVQRERSQLLPRWQLDMCGYLSLMYLAATQHRGSVKYCSRVGSGSSGWTPAALATGSLRGLTISSQDRCYVDTIDAVPRVGLEVPATRHVHSTSYQQALFRMGPQAYWNYIRTADCRLPRAQSVMETLRSPLYCMAQVHA